jgi:tetratricopeptide (TPR) repeat protein
MAEAGPFSWLAVSAQVKASCSTNFRASLQGIAGRPVLLRGSVINGTYMPAPQQVEPVPSALSAAAELTARFAVLTGQLEPLIGQIISSVSDLQRIQREFASSRAPTLSGPRLLQRALRALADARGVCLAVESNAVGALWWADLIESLSVEADVDLRLLTIIGLEGHAELPSDDDDAPELVRLARSLVQSGRAEWRCMPRLDGGAVEALIGPSAPDVRERLSGVSEGQAGWVVELFDEWRRRGVVAKDRRRRWTFDHTMLNLGIAPTKVIVDDRIREVLGADRRSFIEAKRFLVLAALQGETFVLAPIAEYLGLPIAACERLASRLTRDEGCRPLLERVGENPIKPVYREASQYLFTDRFIWFSLIHYGFGSAERRDAAAKCARSLEQIYASDPTPIAGTLEHLYALAENVAERGRWRRIAEVRPAGDQLRWQAKAVIEDEGRWSRWSQEQAIGAANFLLGASLQLSRMRPRDELFSLLEAAERMARMHGLSREHAKAIRFQGELYAVAGDYNRARERLDTASRILGPSIDPLERADLLCDQAYLESLDENVAQALSRLNQAISACQALSDATRVEARARDLRGKITLGHGSASSAHDDLAAATQLYRALDDVDGVNSSMTAMAAAQIAQNDTPAAIETLREVIAVAQTTGNKIHELYAQEYLGSATQDHKTACQHHKRALVLARELNDAPVESDALLSLARRSLALRQWDKAGRLLKEGFDLHNRLKDEIGVAWCLLEIGILQTNVGALLQAEKNLKAALEQFSAKDIREGLAGTHSALGALAARRGDRRTAKREFAIASSLGAITEHRGHVVRVSQQVRPRRSWHPKG